jgi:hypothetical protein
MDDRAFAFRRIPARGPRPRSLALALLALLPMAAAAQNDSAVLEWRHDAAAEVAEFRIYYGRTPEALSAVKLVLDPDARRTTIDGLDEGTWYFAVVAVGPGAVESEPSNLYCVVIPSGSCDVPLAAGAGRPRDGGAAAAPASRVRVSIGNLHPTNGGFDLAIEGRGAVTIELGGGLVFDWCSPQGMASLPTLTPTTPSLGERDDDGNRRQTVTFTAPVERTRCDGDGARAFSGATATVGDASKPLVESNGSWSAQFP